MSLKLGQGPKLSVKLIPDLVSVTSYGPPDQISMTSLGHPNQVSMTSLGQPHLVSMTIGTRILKKRLKKEIKMIFSNIFTKFIVILRRFYFIYVKMSRQCTVPLIHMPFMCQMLHISHQYQSHISLKSRSYFSYLNLGKI